jgi:hypothetical protein
MSKLRKNDYFTIQWDQVVEDAETDVRNEVFERFDKFSNAKMHLKYMKQIKEERGNTVFQVRSTSNSRGISSVMYDVDESSCTGIQQKYCQKVYKRDLTPPKQGL